MYGDLNGIVGPRTRFSTSRSALLETFLRPGLTTGPFSNEAKSAAVEPSIRLTGVYREPAAFGGLFSDSARCSISAVSSPSEHAVGRISETSQVATGVGLRCLSPLEPVRRKSATAKCRTSHPLRSNLTQAAPVTPLAGRH